MSEREINILFPVSILRPGLELLDPNNTETIWEYYLLENLSCGLVRDSKVSAGGYEGCIADWFYQEDANSWSFHICQLLWSDSSVITSDDILGWIKSLQCEDKRHIKYLKQATDIGFSEDTRILKIRFPFKIDFTLLHELSLADSGLYRSDYRTAGWGKTTGPYFVEEWNQKENILKLSANKQSPLYETDMPQKVMLSRLSDPALRGEIFKTVHYDVVPIVPSASLMNVKLVLPNAPQVWTSNPLAIFFIYFNYANVVTHSLINRKRIEKAIKEFRLSIPRFVDPVSTFDSEDQMIPFGFNGRLPRLSAESISVSSFQELIVKIRMSTWFSETPELTKKMIEVFKKHGLILSIEFSDRLDFNKDEFGGTYSFLGNRLDASGSWSFLTGEPFGTLSLWISEYSVEHTDYFDLQNIGKQKFYSQKLHEVILNRAIAVPMMVGCQRYLLSNSVDGSGLNKFDARLRINSLRWRAKIK